MQLNTETSKTADPYFLEAMAVDLSLGWSELACAFRVNRRWICRSLIRYLGFPAHEIRCAGLIPVASDAEAIAELERVKKRTIRLAGTNAALTRFAIYGPSETLYRQLCTNNELRLRAMDIQSLPVIETGTFEEILKSSVVRSKCPDAWERYAQAVGEKGRIDKSPHDRINFWIFDSYQVSIWKTDRPSEGLDPLGIFTGSAPSDGRNPGHAPSS